MDSAALQDLEPVISAANIDAFFMLRGLPPPNFTKVFADEDALPEHLITEYLGSSLHVDIIPKGNILEYVYLVNNLFKIKITVLFSFQEICVSEFKKLQSSFFSMH